MENDTIFAAEAEAEARGSLLRASNRNGKGKLSRTTSSTSKRSRDEESTPLLGERRGSIDDGERSRASGDEVPEWDFSRLPWWKRPSIFWLLPPFALFTLAFGGIVVPKLNLILELICRDYYSEKGIEQSTKWVPSLSDHGELQCQTNEVSSRTSLFILYGNLCSGLLSAITSPKLGALSDRYGRKGILILNTAGMLIGEVLTILAAKYPDTFDVNWILVGYALDGLCGSFIVGMALAHSYAVDCTPPGKRNVTFGYFHACLFTGIAAGPILAGKVIKATKNVLSVFYIAIGAHVFFIIFLAFFIPESLSKSRQRAARETHRAEMERLGPTADWINQLRSINLLAPLKILYPTGRGSSPALRRNLILLAAVDTIMFGIAMGAMGVLIIYTNLQFGWGNWETSKYVSIVNSARVLVLVLGLPLATRMIRGKEGTYVQRHSGSDLFDLTVIRIAVFFDMLGFLGYTLSRSGPLFTLSGVVASIGGLGSPTLGAALTKHVPADRTGQLLGATGLLHAIARVIGPTVFNGIYYATVGKFRQTVFACLTGTFLVAFFASWFVQPHVYLDENEALDHDDDDQDQH